MNFRELKQSKMLVVTLALVLLANGYFTVKYYFTFEPLIPNDPWADIYLLLAPAILFSIILVLVICVLTMKSLRFSTFLQLVLLLKIIWILGALFIKESFENPGDLTDLGVVVLYSYCITILQSFKAKHRLANKRGIAGS